MIDPSIEKNSVPHTPTGIRINNASTSKIAIFRALQLGDMLCAIPTIRAIRRQFPHARISLIGLAWQQDLVRRFPGYFDEFIEFGGWPGLPEKDWNPEESIAFVKSMQQKNFDLVLQMQGNGLLTNSMCLLWAGKFTCGLRRSYEQAPGDGLFPVSDNDEDHEILRFFKLLDGLDIPAQGSFLEFNVFPGELSTFENISAHFSISPERYICIHPGARDVKRRWSAEYFGAIARTLYEQGFTIVLTGSTAELETLNAVERHANVPLINTIRELHNVELGVLAAIIKHSILLVSNDTGVSHLAVALEVPSVIIFSAHSSEKRWAPLNTERHLVISHTDATDVSHVIQSTLTKLNRLVSSRSEMSR
jgi:ADP-heptose:LPS heptosyltransferase